MSASTTSGATTAANGPVAEFDPEDGVTTATAVIDNGSFGSRSLTFETGRLAKQAAGSVVVTMGDSMLLSATTAGRSPKEQFDFFPLTVDVEERMYAAGKIPGGFFKREGRPTEKAILTARMIDRPIRPATTMSNTARSSSLCRGKATHWPSTSATRTPPIGPLNGRPDSFVDIEAALIATTS